MEKNRISFFFSRYEISYFENLIKQIPKDLCRVILLESEEGPHDIPINSEFHAQYWGFHDIFTSGYEIYVANNEMIRNSDFSVTTAAIYYYNKDTYKWINTEYVEALRDVYLVHSSDGSGTPPKSSKWMIAQHMKMALAEEANKYSKTGNNDRFLSLLASENVTEYAYTGLYTLGEWENKRTLPKTVLQREMERILGKKLRKKLPVLVFFQDELSDWRECVAGLNELSKSANIIYKSYGKYSDWVRAALNDDVYIWPSERMAQNILRFAADGILAGYQSGTFITSVMLGPRVIPYHTGTVFDSSTKQHVGWEYFLRKDSMHAKAIDYLKLSLLNMKDCSRGTLHDILCQNICNEQWETMKKNVFLDFMIDGATQKTAQLILRAFNRGTFGNDVVALRENICM